MCLCVYFQNNNILDCQCRFPYIYYFNLRKKQGFITKTLLYNFDPLKPLFYKVKLGLQGYTLFFLFLLKNIKSGYSLEPPRRGGSYEYLQSRF